MSDPGYIGNVPPAVPAGTLTNPVAPDAQVPTSTSARMLDNTRDTNGAGMMAYNAFLMYPPGTVGRAILDAGLGTAPWGNITGDINDQLDLMAQFTIRDNALTAGLALKLNVSNPTVTGTLTLDDGTTTVAPMRFAPGVLLSAPVNDSFEWDGTWLYITNGATQRKRLAQLDIGTNVLPVAQGGTGAGAAAGARTNLGSTAVGDALFVAANAASARTTIGATTLGNGIFTAADAAAVLALLGITGQPTYRNLSPNGDISINILVQGAATTTATYFADAWQTSNTATARLTTQQSTSNPAPGFPFNLLSTVTTAGAPSAGDFHNHNHSFEGSFMRRLGWGAAGALSLALTVLVRCSVAGTYALAVRNASNARSYVTPLVVNSPNTWETKTVVIPGDTSGTWPTGNVAWGNVTVGMAIGSTFQTGSQNTWLAGNFIGLTGQTQLTSTNGATFQITGFQAEVGAVATPFEFLSQDLLLYRNRRYFETSYPYGVAPGTANTDGQFRIPALDANTLITLSNLPRVEKMAAPTEFTSYNPFTGAITSVRSTSAGTNIAVTNYNTPTLWGPNTISSAGGFTTGQFYDLHWRQGCRI